MISTLLKDILRYSPSKIIPILFSIIIIPVFTRIFSPENYGQYVIVITTISILNIISVDWITTSITRFYADYEKKLQLKLFNGTIIRLSGCSICIIAIISFLILFFLEAYSTSPLYHYLNLALIVFILSASLNVMLQLLVVQRKPIHFSLITIWRQCICLLIGIGIITIYNTSINGLLLGIAIGLLIILPIVFKLTFKNFINIYSQVLSKDIVHYGIPLCSTNLAGFVLAMSDRYIIEYFRGSHEVGLYSIAYTLADRSIQSIVSLLMLSSAPIVMRLWETKDERKTATFISNLTRIYLIIGFPLCVGLSLLSEPLMKILTTEKFYAGYRIIPIIAASIFLFGLQRNFQLGILFHKKTKLVMYLLISSGMINIILNILLVPDFGYIAAGYTTLISYIIFVVAIICFSRRYFIWEFPFQTLLKVTISVSLMSILVLFIIQLEIKPLAFTIVLAIFSGSIVYMLLLFLMGELHFDPKLLDD